MTAEYGARASSSSNFLPDPFSVEEHESRNYLASRKRRCKPCYYVCLGTLAHMVHAQLRKKYAKSDRLYWIGTKYARDLYKWMRRCKRKKMLTNDFYGSFVASLTLFAVGAKLANELTDWTIF